jgi:ribosomal protein S19
MKGTRIFSDFLEKDITVYNGLKHVTLNIRREMLSTFVGSYVLTKRITSDIHSKTKKNKKGRMKKK